jgi:DNA primase
MQYLKAYPGEIVIAYDNDEAGREGLERFERLRKRLCIDNISYVFPEGEKDWNSILINKGESALRQTLQNYKKYSWENNMDVIVSAL